MNNVIYKIRNIVNNDFYVGSTIDSRVRFQDHRRKLRKGKHKNLHLQAAWNKYGEDCFRFEIVEIVSSQDKLFEVEQRWLAEHVGKDYCYNFASDAFAPMRGRKHSEETICKLKQAAQKTPRGKEHYRYGKTLDEEIRKKIGDTQRGVSKAPRVISEEGKAKIRKAAEAGHYSNWKGKTHSEESKAKMGRSIIATDPKGVEHTYSTITMLRKELNLTPPTVDRALKSGMRLVKGKVAGWSFRYAEDEKNPELEIPEKFLDLPRSRQEAKEKDSRYYFTGKPCERGHIAPRLTKGVCIVCRKEDWATENEKRRMRR